MERNYTLQEAYDKRLATVLIDSAAGQYIPKEWAEDNQPHLWGIGEESAAILRAGPNHNDPSKAPFCAAEYWDVWCDVLNSAVRQSGERGAPGGFKFWRLHHDGDLWAVCTQVNDDDVTIDFEE